MITITQARELTLDSSVVLKEYVETIGQAIEAACKLGKRVLILGDAFPTDPLWTTVRNGYSTPNLGTKRHLVVLHELLLFGFRVTTEQFQQQVGGGLGSIDDQPRMETWGRYIIAW